MERRAWVGIFSVAFFAACSLEVPPFQGGSDGGPPSTSPPPNVTEFTAVPSAVPPGARVRLSWSVEHATNVSITAMPGGSVIDGSSMPTGTTDSAPLEAATTFELTAAGPGGTSQAVRLVTIDPSALAIIELGARPDPAAVDSNAELFWKTSGASSVVLKRGDTTLYTAPVASLAAGAILSPVLAAPVDMFTLEVSNGAETKTASLALRVEAPPEINEFRASPPTFTGAANVELSWFVRDATELRLFEDGAEVGGLAQGAMGMITRAIDTTTIYDLIATSGGGTVKKRIWAAQLSDELEPNDDFGRAQWITTGAISGELSGDGDTDVYALMVGWNTTLFATVENADGTCPFASVLTLYDGRGNHWTEISRDRNGDLISDCPAMDPRRLGYPTDLSLGLFYLTVGSLEGAGRYTLIVDGSAPRCGNGVVERGEQCDDSNLRAGDNCSASCRHESAALFGLEGGTTVLNLTRFDPKTSSYYRWIAVDLVSAGRSIEIHTSDPGGASCAADTSIQISDGSTTFLYAPEDEGIHGCANVDFPDNWRAVGLPAGWYYVRIANRDPLAAAAVEVSITIHEPACGNFAVEPGEQCDDGNVAGGDGCNTRCEVEPRGMVGGPPAEDTFQGTINAEGHIDGYAITLREPGYIVAETYVPAPPGCAGDTVLHLASSSFDEFRSFDDLDPQFCAYFEPSPYYFLEPGRYWLGVSAFGPYPVPYTVHIRTYGAGCGNGIAEPFNDETCDDGNLVSMDGCSATCVFEGTALSEVEPNDTSAQATPVNVPEGTTLLTSGQLLSTDDLDLFELVISGTPANVRAITHTVIGAPGQCGDDLDTNLRLLDAGGAELANHDDIDVRSGNYCSLIELQNLQPATYYIEVKAWQRPIPDYFLTIDVQ